MTYPFCFDVLIIGAGPAGSTLARSLGLSGANFKVGLVDRALFPRDKSCGDGIGPSAVAIAKELGLAPLLKDYQKIELMGVAKSGVLQLESQLPRIKGKAPEGYVIPRKQFDQCLLQAAQAVGAELWQGYSFETASYDASQQKWLVTIKNDKETLQLTTKLLVGADGAKSKVRRFLQVPDNNDQHTAIATRVYATTKKSCKRLLLDFELEKYLGYSWIFPSKEGLLNIGVGLLLANYRKQRQNLKQLLHDYLASLSALDLEVDEASIYSHPLPLGSQLPPLAFQSAALVGDAGSMINPMTGEGIYYGMYAGKLLAETLVEGKARQRNLEKSLALYQQRFVKKFARHFKLCHRLQTLSTGNPRLFMNVLATCRKSPRATSELLEVMMGDRGWLSAPTLCRIFQQHVLRWRQLTV